MKNSNEIKKAVILSTLILSVPILISIALFAMGLFGIGIAMLGMSGLAAIYSIHEIKHPDRGLLFSRGKLAGVVHPGWYLVFHLFWKIEVIVMSLREKRIQNISMYTSENTYIEADVSIFYQAKEDEEGFMEIVYLMDPETRISETTLARLKKASGIRAFEETRKEVSQIEEEILVALKIEMKRGWDVTDVEISNLSEKIKSRAAEIRMIGDAEAEVKNKMAKAFSEPLRNNYPAAIASSVNNISTSIEKAVKDIFKKTSAKKSESGEKSEKTVIELDSDSANKIMEMLKGGK